MVIGCWRSKSRCIHHVAIGIKAHGKRNRCDPGIVISDGPSHIIGRDIGNGHDLALGRRDDELMGELALYIYALHPRTLFKALDNRIAIDVEQRRVVGEVDKLLSGLLRNMLRTVDLDIRGGKEARLEQNGPNDKKNHDHGSGGACNKTS